MSVAELIQEEVNSLPEAKQREVLDFLKKLSTPARKRSDGKKMAEALEKLAESGAFADITDPVEWQREIRKDRPLPGRD